MNEIAKAVDIDLTQNDIEACHRLHSRNHQKGPKRTIVRFVNRKFAEKLLKKGKLFKDRKVCNVVTTDTYGEKLRNFMTDKLLILFGFLTGQLTSDLQTIQMK